MTTSNIPLTTEGAALREQLRDARAQEDLLSHAFDGSRKIHVAGIGQAISAAYEQLRNAAANTEEHLLLQQAIRRFLKRNISFFSKNPPKALAEELIVELTQAGYLQNDTIAVDKIRLIDTAIAKSFAGFLTLRAAGVAQERAINWTLDILCVELEGLHNAERSRQDVFIHFAYRHFKELFAEDAKKESFDHYDASLYIATHRALLRSDVANVRRDMLQLYRLTIASVPEYIEANQRIDKLYTNETTNRLTRAVSKYGAPFRVMRSMLADGIAFEDLMLDREKFLSAFSAQVEVEHKRTADKLNRGVIKSIIFLFITKVIIGLAIEVPYDIFLTGTVVWLPLAVNILFPPVYMALLRMSLKMPGRPNYVAIRDYVDGILYETQNAKWHITPLKRVESSMPLTILYGLMFVVSFGAVVAVLSLLHFNFVQGVIFF
ncbi:MAG TPA: hypothetical protein VFZ48_02655, partial [Candidatus Saccharimonadales bacterium]